MSYTTGSEDGGGERSAKGAPLQSGNTVTYTTPEKWSEAHPAQVFNALMDVLGVAFSVLLCFRAHDEALIVGCFLAVLCLSILCILGTDRRRTF